MPNVELPGRYKDVLQQIDRYEVEYGTGGLKVFAEVELPKGQVGYAFASDGKSLCNSAGGWQSDWLVIGYDTGVGDPLILNTSGPQLPVFTSVHGEGKWELQPVAISVESFAACLDEFAKIALGRSNPVETDRNPLPDADREAYRTRIAAINENKIAPDFWDALLEY